MPGSWSILYRGPLSSCNYECSYCPFAKTMNTREELRADETKLDRFIAWVDRRPEEIGILFTPWGEALGYRYYQRALCDLSQKENVRRVAIQTNLSCHLDWLSNATPQRLAFWCTFHPTQTELEPFVQRCHELHARGFRFSVGVVGTKDSFQYLTALRMALPDDVYVWVNALKRQSDYYTEDEIRFLTDLDPWFPLNNRYHESSGRACRTGHTVFSVDGEGEMRRCHFVKEVIGNIYRDEFESALKPRLCPAETCGCHIGYVHLEELQLDAVFGQGLLERIPQLSRLDARPRSR